MSSDSDDDFCYTNTVSMLNNLKKNISITEEKNLPDEVKDEIITLDEVKSPIKKTQLDSDILSADVPKTPSTNALVISSDEEKSPINLISKIDSVLTKGKRKTTNGRKQQTRWTPPSKNTRRGRGRRTVTNAKKQNQQILNNASTPTIWIVEDNNDLEDANYDVDVKVLWMSQYVKKFSVRRFEKLHTIYKYFSEKENIPENKIIFTIEKNDVIVSKNDTPDSLNINAATIIEGGIISAEKSQSNNPSKPNKDCVEFKVQLKDRKRPLMISIKSVDKMEVLMHKTAIELDVNVKSLKFYFDGDLIKSNDTVESLQLEGGECIDCTKSN